MPFFPIPLESCPLFLLVLSFFFFNDTATTEIYTLSLHDALPISTRKRARCDSSTNLAPNARARSRSLGTSPGQDRKSTRLNSSHITISYAVFCLKKKNKKLETLGTALDGNRDAEGSKSITDDADG